MNRIFEWIRVLIIIVILYGFFYEYLYVKYHNIMSEFDEFNWHDRFGHQCDLSQVFNFTEKSITGSEFGAGQQNDKQFSYVGTLVQFETASMQKVNKRKQQISHNLMSKFLQQISIKTKKVDSYQFNFYNWYRFELTFTDVGHDSYLQFRLSQKKKGSHEIVQKIAFKLPESFYPKTAQDKDNKFSISYKAKGVQLHVQQQTVAEHYNDPQSDGLQQQLFFHLTENKTEVTPEEYKKFGSSKTLTQFNFTFARKDYEISAHMSHVIRHNQCVTNYQNGVLRHKCMGGYGKGKINFSQFRREQINTKQNRYTGNWERNSYNLDNSRVRTTFVGQRMIGNQYVQKFIPKIQQSDISLYQKPQQSYKTIEIDFIGFNKPEYYTKQDRIQKERWVGMTLHCALQPNGSPQDDNTHESYFFINGNIHPIYQIQFELPYNKQSLSNGNIITFKNNVSQNLIHRITPSFDIELQIQNSTLVEQRGLFGNTQIYRIDGYWKGWIDEGTLFQNQTLRNHYNSTYEFGFVEFYEIEGTIKITQEFI